MNLINVETSKKFWKFQDIKDSDESLMAQKSFNVGETQLKLPMWLKECKIGSDIPWYSIQGSVLGGKHYQEHLINNGLIRPLNLLLDDFNRDRISTNLFHQRATAEILNAKMSNEVLELSDMEFERLTENNSNYSLVTRSANGVREDEAMKKSVLTAEQFAELASKSGAGKHETYANHNTKKKFRKGTLKVWASTFSFAACDDFKGLRVLDEWLHLTCLMDVIWMHQIHSQKCASYIGFGDVLGTGFNLSVSPYLYGEEGVSGKTTGIDVQINGNLLGSDAAIVSKSQKLDVPDSWLESAGRIMNYIQRTKGYIVDVEGAIGYKDPTDPSSLVITLPQQRANLPIEIVRNSPYLEQHKVIKTPNAPIWFTGKCHSNYKCGVGVLTKINSESEIRTIDPTGKILVADEAYTSHTGIKRKIKGSLTKKGGLSCHWGLQTKGLVPWITSIVQLIQDVIYDEIVTILKNEVYLGDHTDCWEVLKIDLRDILLPKNITLKLVFGDPLSIDQIYPLFKWGLVKDFALCRWEEIFWSLDLPSIFDWLYFDKIDLSTEEGRNSKAKIQTVMDSYGISDPVEAYYRRFTAGVQPLAELAKMYGGKFGLRGYGARMDEDAPNIIKGVIPFPESNPQYGFNGVPMYLTDWGSCVYVAIIEVLKRLHALGYTNVPLYLPNIATPEELKKLLQKAVDLGFDLTNVELELMIENLEASYNIPNFIAIGKEYSNVSMKFPIGWNDKTQNAKGMAIRVLPELACERSNVNTPAMKEMAFDTVSRIIRHGGIAESCGLASEAIMEGMFLGGATACGTPEGIDLINAAKFFRQLEQNNS